MSEQVAVVTGAGSGLGAAMADVFARADIAVACLDIDGDNAAATAARVEAAGVPALACRVDVADRASVDAAADAVRRQFGGCDILCANVGVQQFGAIDRLTEQDWQWVLSVNVLGVVHTVGAFLPLLRARQGERHILLTSSSSAFVPGVRLGAYVTSKYAVTGYGEVLRQELEPEGIGVSILFPAGMSTRHLESSKLARPEELGPSVTLSDDIEAMLSSRDMKEATHVATPEHAVRNLLADLRADEPYIITHGAYRPQVEERFARILDAFRRMESS
jgi:NAD(P)-dependent dehydrogenase (short-subunit alcohol dehydrogenase family)